MDDPYPKIRLFVEQPLAPGAAIMPEGGQAHYLLHVMRMRVGMRVALFNGKDGEWLAEITSCSKKTIALTTLECLKPQAQETLAATDLWLLFAPIKTARMEYMVEKSVELGVTRICPIITAHTVVRKVGEERLRAQAVEAAEQSGRLSVPDIIPATELSALLGGWDAKRRLFFGDEGGASPPARQALSHLVSPAVPCAVLVGPEGGFSRSELEHLRQLPFAQGIGLGPRVLRADTAAIAALALVQSWHGDWDAPPRWEARE